MSLRPTQKLDATQMLVSNIHPSVVRDILGLDPRTLRNLMREHNIASEAESVSRKRIPPAIVRMADAVIKAPDRDSTLAILTQVDSPQTLSLLLRVVAQQVQTMHPGELLSAEEEPTEEAV